jgi:ABC-2 type transport system permease protein/oleandomycin transport system permease protein
LTFASSVFVQASSMPGWLRIFANHQPISVMANTVRGLLLNQPNTTTILLALAWCLGIMVAFNPLAVWAYKRRTTR